MKIKHFYAAMAVSLTLAAPTLALANGFYGSVQLGISQQANDNEAFGNNIAVDPDFPAEFDAGDGNMGGVGLGYRFNERLRVEGRVNYRESSFDSRKIGTGALAGEEYILNGEIESTSLTLEGFYDFTNGSAFTPYVKAGIGASKNSYSAKLGGAGVAAFDPFDGVNDGYYDGYADGDSTEFSWNVGLGATYAIGKQLYAFGEYQYAVLGDMETEPDAFTDGFKIDNAASHEVMLGLRMDF